MESIPGTGFNSRPGHFDETGCLQEFGSGTDGPAECRRNPVVECLPPCQLVTAALEREQQVPTWHQYPGELCERRRYLIWLHVDDRVVHQQSAETVVGDVQVNHGTHLEGQVRAGTPGDVDHGG